MECGAIAAAIVVVNVINHHNSVTLFATSPTIVATVNAFPARKANNLVVLLEPFIFVQINH